jgi:hypothetical protein
MSGNNKNEEVEYVPEEEQLLNSFTSMKNSCVEYVDEKGDQYYVKLVAPEERRANRAGFRAAVQSFTKLYDPTTFLGAPDGVYTWIVSDKGFLTARVLSIFELGTLHKQLASYLGATKILVAGECQKVEDSVTINLQSGTFTLQIIQKVSERNTTITERLERMARETFQNIGFDHVKVNVDRGGKSLIRRDTVPVSKDELQLYKAAGFHVELYTKKEDCTQYQLQYQLIPNKSRLTLLVKQKQQEVIRLKEYESSGNPKAKWLTRSPNELKMYEEQLAATEAEIARVEAEIATSRQLFGGGRGRRRLTRRSSRRRIANKSRRSN